MAVSYTHLDVYKRQACTRTDIQDFDLRAKIKLLLIHQAAKTIVYILHGGDKLYQMCIRDSI